GPLSLVDKALDAGLYFSINPAMLRNEKGRKVVAALPHDRAMTESDGPFAKAYGHSTRPSDISRLVSDLARLWDSDARSVRQQVFDNLGRLYASTAGKSGRPAPQ